MTPAAATRCLVALAAGLAASGFTAAAAAQEAPDSGADRGIFFGGTLGGGWAWIDHPEIERRGRSGAVWDLHFGWRLSRRLMLGGQFSTWGTSITGTPVHLHTIGPRIDVVLGRAASLEGPFLSAIPGLALIEGDLDARAGAGAALAAGYRLRIARWTTLAALAGAHGHTYRAATASVPFVALELRFHGGRR